MQSKDWIWVGSFAKERGSTATTDNSSERERMDDGKKRGGKVEPTR